MVNLKRALPAVLAAVLVFETAPMTAWASTRRAIKSVSLTIESDIRLDTRLDVSDVEVSVSGDKCHVEEVEFLNDEVLWTETSVPVLEITLGAEEEYYFNLNEGQGVSLKGEKTGKVSWTTEDFAQTLKVSVALEPLNEKVGEVPSASWIGMKAVWEPALGAGSYEVKLMRGGRTAGSVRTTSVTELDLKSSMTKAGEYTFQVRPVNALNPENKGGWTESGVINVDNAKAAENRGYGGSAQGENTGWQQDEVGWWYRNADGTCLKNTWKEIEGRWYCFDENGYMKTGWVQREGKWYYYNADGTVMKNGVTPDGFTVGEDGAWISEKGE